MRERERERERGRERHGRGSMAIGKLAKYPELIQVGWIHNAMTKAKAHGEQISPQEWEYAREVYQG